jgi:hypothetical protein
MTKPAKESIASETSVKAARLVTALDKEWNKKQEYNLNAIKKFESAQAILQSVPEVQIAVAHRIIELVAECAKRAKARDKSDWFTEKNCPWGCTYFLSSQLKRRLPFCEEDLFRMFGDIADIGFISASQFPFVGSLVSALERHVERETLSKRLRVVIGTVHDNLLGQGKVRRLWEPDADDRKAAARIERLLMGPLDLVVEQPESQVQETDRSISEKDSGRRGREARSAKFVSRLQKLIGTLPKLPLFPGEAWSDAAMADLKKMPRDLQSAWLDVLAHCQAASGSSPPASWIKKAGEVLKVLTWPRFKKTVLAWLPLVNQPRTKMIAEWYRDFQPDPNQLIIEPHSELLKGLSWLCGLREDVELARALTALALSCYRKIPKKGPREVKVGNACVTALGMMPGMEGVGQLALLKVRVKFGTAQKMIEKALETTAARVGLPREELEEMAVPAYGLTEVGRCTEKFGDYTAELTVTGTNSTEIAWLKADGKHQQSVPAVVKEKFAEELKELQAAAKDIQRMLPAQRERIDSLFLQQKRWPLAVWRERYLDHPLVGVLARRLLWVFTNGKKHTTGIWFNGQIVDIDLKPMKDPGAETTVTLWHPIGRDLDEIVGWRAWLDAQQIQQPFKQAHREVYVLTDAERRTNTYSNRFAAHLLKQHQFNALAALRGWKNKLRLMVDDEFPPASRLLPQWGLRAEFWIEGAGDNYGTDTNETGTFLRVATDQVRFYPMEAPQRTAHAGGGGYHAVYREADGQPLPLEEVPALVFSEIMRDVDLFVGVASVGNDPTWNDGGPEGQYRDYWQTYSFGDLSATAQTRKEVLQRLVPRLKIASQCSFADKFLVVKGNLRSYKVHLGSGNILMEPNDQYLCIVPDRGGAAAKSGEKVFLPFEGDSTLSIILSKAFLLAEDAKIKDETILRQIKAR